MLIRGSRIILTQEFREDAFSNKSAVAVGIVGRAVTPDIANETEVRLTSDSVGEPYHLRYANSNESVWGARDTDEDLFSMRGAGVRCRMRNPWGAAKVKLRRNDASVEALSGDLLSFETAKRETIALEPV